MWKIIARYKSSINLLTQLPILQDMKDLLRNRARRSNMPYYLINDPTETETLRMKCQLHASVIDT